jgi:hypothetical protein
MTTPILGIAEIAGSQSNQYATANEMVRALESAGNELLAVSLASSDVTLTASQFNGAYIFNCTGNAVPRNMTVPMQKRAFVVKNGGSAILTIVRGSSTVAVDIGVSIGFFTDGTTNGLSTVGSAGGGGVTGWLSGKNTSAPNATIPVVYFSPDDAAANVDIAIQAKGTNGAFMLAVPDNATSGGNKRGSYSIDLQLNRSAASQVASGSGSVAIGRKNTSSGSGSVAIGDAVTSTGTTTVALGGACNVTGSYSAAFPYNSDATAIFSLAMGSNCIAAAEGAVAIGRYAESKAVKGQLIYANGRFFSGGDTQKTTMLLRGATTNATASVLTYDASSASAVNQRALVNGSVLTFTGMINARQNTTGDTAAWQFSGAIKRGASAATTVLMAAVTPVLVAADAGAAAWAVSVTADTGNGALKIEVTGEASKSIRWNCVIDALELAG